MSTEQIVNDYKALKFGIQYLVRFIFYFTYWIISNLNHNFANLKLFHSVKFGAQLLVSKGPYQCFCVFLLFNYKSHMFSSFKCDLVKEFWLHMYFPTLSGIHCSPFILVQCDNLQADNRNV